MWWLCSPNQFSGFLAFVEIIFGIGDWLECLHRIEAEAEAGVYKITGVNAVPELYLWAVVWKRTVEIYVEINEA
ncbi:hypothetical protein AT59_21875 [Aeromonas hydrophila AD9]|nr:hypothetical protein AT59_21875 [Aeromonas hydrophila AD9]